MEAADLNFTNSSFRILKCKFVEVQVTGYSLHEK